MTAILTVSLGLLLLMLFAVCVHEAGHYLMARSLGYPARLIVCRKGVGVRWGIDERVSPPADRLLVTAAGPGVSLIVGGLLALLWAPAVLIACFGAVQLVPLQDSDGWHMWKVLRP